MNEDKFHLTEEQISLLKNPPDGGPFHEVCMSQQKLIDEGYLERVPSKETYRLTEKGKNAVAQYDRSKF